MSISASAAQISAQQAAELAQFNSATREIWSECAVGVFFIIVRLGMQVRNVGIRHLYLDDYMMILVLAAYITATAGCYEVLHLGGMNTYWTDAQRAAFTPSQVDSLTKGTKWFFAVAVLYIPIIYGTKSALTIFLGRLTKGLPIRKWVTYTHYAIIFGALVNFTVEMSACTPFNRRFQVVPAPPKHCQLGTVYYEINTAPLNIILDFVLIIIPIKVLWKSQLCTSRKIFIVVLCSGGLFTAVALLLRLVLALSPNVKATVTPALWVCREWLVTVLVANAPIIGPLFTFQWWKEQDSPSCSSEYLSHGSRKDSEATAYSPSKVMTRNSKNSMDSTQHIIPGRGNGGIGLQALRIEQSKTFEVTSHKAFESADDLELARPGATYTHRS